MSVVKDKGLRIVCVHACMRVRVFVVQGSRNINKTNVYVWEQTRTLTESWDATMGWDAWKHEDQKAVTKRKRKKKNAFRLLWSACQHMLETDKKSEKQFADSSEERDRDSVV